MHTNSIVDGPTTNLLSILSILIEIVSCTHAKGENALMISNWLFSERLRGKLGSERVNVGNEEQFPGIDVYDVP